MKAKVISRKGQALLVQYEMETGFPQRIIVPIPADEPQSGEIELSEEEIETAIPYGIQWIDEVEEVCISSEEIIKTILQYGIWTNEDFANNPGKVNAVVSQIARPVLVMLKSIAKRYGG